jgi:hypothetical protein
LWRAEADPTQIELVLLNSAINARDAMSEGGSLNVETSNVRTELPDRPNIRRPENSSTSQSRIPERHP